MDLRTKLQGLEGEVVRLSFSDGEQVDARIAAVDVHDHGGIVYSVLRVVRHGPASDYEPGCFYTSTIDTVIDVSSVGRD